MQVTFKPNAQGALISTYAKNPKFGYVTLMSEETFVDPAGWIRKSKRTALLRADVETLTSFVTMHKTGVLPGRIVTREYVLSEAPQSFLDRLRTDVSQEEALEPYYKRAGEGGAYLTAAGERIVRWTEYDATGKSADVLVAHDNGSEVREARATATSAGATL